LQSRNFSDVPDCLVPFYLRLPPDNTKSGAWLQITLREGKNRQIRRTGARIGLPVRQIKRISIGPIELGKLQPGHFRYLKDDEIAALQKYAELK